MDEHDSNVVQYLVPANVSARFEFFEGFGWHEFLIVLITAILGFLVYSGLGGIKKTVVVNKDGISVITESKDVIIKEDGTVLKKVPLIPSVIRFLAIALPTAVSFFIVIRDPNTGMSVLTMFKSMKEFKQKQKLYLYKYDSGKEI